MGEVQTLVDRIVASSGDLDPTIALDRFNAAHKTMINTARGLRKTLSAGVTTAGQAAYSVPAGILEVYELSVAGMPYGRARHVDQLLGALGRLTISGDGGGVFAPTASSSGVEQVQLYPIPSAAGNAISVFAAVRAPTLTVGDDPLVDDDMWDAIVDGALAKGRLRDDELFWSAQAFAQIFEQAVQMYTRRVARRYKGTGPSMIRVIGLNA